MIPGFPDDAMAKGIPDIRLKAHAPFPGILFSQKIYLKPKAIPAACNQARTPEKCSANIKVPSPAHNEFCDPKTPITSQPHSNHPYATHLGEVSSFLSPDAALSHHLNHLLPPAQFLHSTSCTPPAYPNSSPPSRHAR